MKRWLAILLSALLLASAVPMVSAAGIYNDDKLNWDGFYDPNAPCSHLRITQVAAVASTCIVAGHEAYTLCIDCDAVLEGSKDALPLVDHTYDDDQDADCNACGAVREVVASKPGDLNGDGRINNKDLGLLQQYLSDWDVTIDEKAADVNDDGRLNNKDLGLMQQYLADWDVILK